jgi:hypothetical protein
METNAHFRGLSALLEAQALIGHILRNGSGSFSVAGRSCSFFYQSNAMDGQFHPLEVIFFFSIFCRHSFSRS